MKIGHVFEKNKRFRCEIIEESYNNAKNLYDDFLKIEPTKEYKDAVKCIKEIENNEAILNATKTITETKYVSELVSDNNIKAVYQAWLGHGGVFLPGDDNSERYESHYKTVTKEVPDEETRAKAKSEIKVLKSLSKHITDFEVSKEIYDKIQRPFEDNLNSLERALYYTKGDEPLPLEEIKSFYELSKDKVENLNNKINDKSENDEHNLTY